MASAAFAELVGDLHFQPKGIGGFAILRNGRASRSIEQRLFRQRFRLEHQTGWREDHVAARPMGEFPPAARRIMHFARDAEPCAQAISQKLLKLSLFASVQAIDRLLQPQFVLGRLDHFPETVGDFGKIPFQRHGDRKAAAE